MSLTHIGPHIVSHADLMTLAPFFPGQVDVVYSDPPWGNLKFWHTLNHKDTGAAPVIPGYDVTTFLDTFFAFCHAAASPSCVMYIEYGQAWRASVMACAERIGLSLCKLYHPTYASGGQMLPLDLFVFSYTPLSFALPSDETVNGTRGYKTLQAVTEGAPMAGRVLLDPCCGMGYSARLAREKGLIFYGNELNAKRLAKTIAVLS